MIKSTFNRTKIIATIGPASSDKEVLEQMIKEGVDVCRLNFSHGSHEQHADVISTIREINHENELHVSILCDLQGPKIRVGELEEDYVELIDGNVIGLTTDQSKESYHNLYINYEQFPKDVKKGDRILLDDGKLELKVVSSDSDSQVKAEVIHGGRLLPKKGVNLPSTEISLPCLTPKDLVDLEFALKNDADWIALSFVRKADDIRELKEIIRQRGRQSKVIAKIEKPQAIENIDEIIDATDAIMIARGDLGVEVPMEELPLLQKKIVKKCLAKGRPVIIATQMMESMIISPSPTRAEINDVANAVMDGADTLMLSGETSVGKYPATVIHSMQKIIQRLERQLKDYQKKRVLDYDSPTFLSDALCKNAVTVADGVNAKAIVGMTHSGYTAYQLSRHRPHAPIFIFSANRALLSQLSLVWGVRCYYYNKYVSTDQTFEDVNQLLRKLGFVEEGEVIVNTASMPIHEKHRTNAIKISVA